MDILKKSVLELRELLTKARFPVGDRPSYRSHRKDRAQTEQLRNPDLRRGTKDADRADEMIRKTIQP